MAPMLAAAFPSSGAASRTGVTRRARLSAVAFDLALLAASILAATVLAAAWLLLRTEAGALDVGRGDAAVAAALFLAASPAWAALLTLEIVSRGATPGMRRAGLTVDGRTPARLIRFAVHPASAAPWLWATVVASLATVPWLPIVLASMTIVVAAGGILSAALALRRADARGIHDVIAGTSMVRA